MPGRRPPDILRKSHAHAGRKERAKGKAALKRELETETEIEEHGAALEDDKEVPSRGHDKHGRRD